MANKQPEGLYARGSMGGLSGKRNDNPLPCSSLEAMNKPGPRRDSLAITAWMK